MSYAPPPVITDTDTVSKVIRALGTREVAPSALWGLHPATVGVAIDELLQVIVEASGGDKSRVEDAISMFSTRLSYMTK